jgi:hypothetical protein
MILSWVAHVAVTKGDSGKATPATNVWHRFSTQLPFQSIVAKAPQHNGHGTEIASERDTAAANDQLTRRAICEKLWPSRSWQRSKEQSSQMLKYSPKRYHSEWAPKEDTCQTKLLKFGTLSRWAEH